MKNHIWKKILWNWDCLFAEIMAAILVLLTFLGAIFRKCFNNPLNWLEEVQVMAIVWIVFLGGCVAFRENSHVVVEVLVEILPTKVQKVISICVNIVVLVVLLIGAFLSFRYLMIFVLNGRHTTILRIPYYIVYSVVPVAFIWMVVNYVRELLGERSRKEEER